MILSVDAALKNFGISVFDDQNRVHFVKTIKTKKSTNKKIRKSEDYGQRICYIVSELAKVVRKYQIQKIYGEMPSFGAQSSNAAISLSAAATIILSLGTIFNIPCIWCPQEAIKKKFTTGTKKEIMEAVCHLYGWPMESRIVNLKKQNTTRIDTIYIVMGEKMSAGTFEHIADSIAAYYICKEIDQ